MTGTFGYLWYWAALAAVSLRLVAAAGFLGFFSALPNRAAP